jgi:hypothetical protein
MENIFTRPEGVKILVLVQTTLTRMPKEISKIEFTYPRGFQSLFYPKNALFEDINFTISWGRSKGGVVMEHEGTLGLN